MSAMLYELTAKAAQMCTPVPAPQAAPDWIDLVDHWQTFIGATTGGLLGVAGAWIVAVSQRRRERRVAAGMVLPDTHQLAAAGAGLARWLESQPNLSAEDRETVAVRMLRESRRPNTLALHSSVIGQLSDIDARLYSHIFQCDMVHRAFEDGAVAQQGWMDAIMSSPIDGRPHIARSAPTDTRLCADWLLCVEHATLSAYFLDRLMFARGPRWVHRLRMKLRPNDLDRRSAHLLTTGQILTLPAQPESAGIRTEQSGHA